MLRSSEQAVVDAAIDLEVVVPVVVARDGGAYRLWSAGDQVGEVAPLERQVDCRVADDLRRAGPSGIEQRVVRLGHDQDFHPLTSAETTSRTWVACQGQASALAAPEAGRWRASSTGTRVPGDILEAVPPVAPGRGAEGLARLQALFELDLGPLDGHSGTSVLTVPWIAAVATPCACTASHASREEGQRKDRAAERMGPALHGDCSSATRGHRQ